MPLLVLQVMSHLTECCVVGQNLSFECEALFVKVVLCQQWTEILDLPNFELKELVAINYCLCTRRVDRCEGEDRRPYVYKQRFGSQTFIRLS